MPNPVDPLTEQQAQELYAQLVNFPQPTRVLPVQLQKKFTRLAGLLASRFCDDPSLDNLLVLLGMPSVAIAPTTTRYRVGDVKNRLSLYPDVPSPVISNDYGERRDSGAVMEKRVIKAVHSGRLSKATQICTSTSNVAAPSAATLQSLRHLHPDGPVNPFGNRSGTRGPSVTTAQVTAAIRSTSYDTAGGPSGWSTSLLKTASKSQDFVRFLTKLANMIAQGTAPGARFLLASSLLPLQQSGATKIRPIAIGEHFYRIAAKVLARNFRSSRDLDSCQLGVGTAGGVEPIVWKVQKALDNNQSGAFIFLDLANAFNSIDRRHLASALADCNPQLLRAARWAYGSPSPLLMRSEAGHVQELLLSAQGVRQGDPLGPLLFSYGFRDRLRRLADLQQLRNSEISAYLDDTLVWLPKDPNSDLTLQEQAQAALDAIAADFRAHTDDGLSLNLAKCQIHTTQDLSHSGVKFLGTCVGTEDFRKAFLAHKVENLHAKILKISKLPRQASFLLLRECVAPTLLHLLRCLDSTGLDEQWRQATVAVQEALRSLAAVPALDEAARVLASLPIRQGGLGLPDYSFIQPHARAASHSLAAEIQCFLEAFDYPPTREDMLSVRPPSTLNQAQKDRSEELLQSLEDNKRISMVENTSPLGSAWVRMIPIYPTRVLSDRQISSALANRLLIQREPADQCNSCHQQAPFHHGDVCEVRRVAPGQARHNRFRDLLARDVRTAGSSAVIECAADAPDANQQLRGDVLVTGSAAPDGIAGVVDIAFTASSSLRNAGRAARITRHPDESVASWTRRQITRMTAMREDDKRRKYAGAFTLPFTPVVFSTGGFPGTKAKAWLKRLGVHARGKLASAFDLSVAIVQARAASL